MGSSLPIVLFVVVGLALVIGLLSLVGRDRAYDEIGRETLIRESDLGDAPEPALADEVCALVEGRNARRIRNGEPPLDVEAEVERQLRELPDAG